MFFVVEDHNPQWKVILHKKSRFICCEVDLFIDSHNINDYVAWLITPLLTPPTNEGPCFLRAKKLSTMDSTIVDERVKRRQEEEQG